MIYAVLNITRKEWTIIFTFIFSPLLLKISLVSYGRTAERNIYNIYKIGFKASDLIPMTQSHSMLTDNQMFVSVFTKQVKLA